MEETVATSIMQKKFQDLTVGDYVKLNLVVAGVTLACLGGLAVVATAKERFDARKQEKKNEKAELTLVKEVQ